MNFKIKALTLSAAILVTLGFTLKSNTVTDLGDYEFLMKRLKATKEYTVEVIDAMPNDRFKYKPNEGVRSFAAQAFHVVYSVEWFIPKLKGQPIKWQPGDEERMSKKELVQYATEQFDMLIAFVQSAKANDKLTDNIIDLLNHNAHHRGQMTTYLRMQGLKPPNYR